MLSYNLLYFCYTMLCVHIPDCPKNVPTVVDRAVVVVIVVGPRCCCCHALLGRPKGPPPLVVPAPTHRPYGRWVGR